MGQTTLLVWLVVCSCFHLTESFQDSPPPRRLKPPYPDGPCGGEVITIPPGDTFGIDVSLARVNFGGDLVLPPRSVKVWLPPEYKESEEEHPVLYVHDGQNAMEDESSWTGASWRLTGALVRLSEHGYLDGPLPIVVMLESAQGDIFPGIRRRHLEYGDTNIFFSQMHADFVAKTVKPLIDNLFRTNSDENYVIGSSMGGNASLHLLLRHSDLFRGAACLSPFFGPFILNDVEKMSDSLCNKKIYIDIGGDVGDAKVPILDIQDHLTVKHWYNPGYFWLDTQLQVSCNAMKNALEKVGTAKFCYQTIPGARHNERAWSERIDKPLLHLFGSLPLDPLS